jgi:arginine repressor
MSKIDRVALVAQIIEEHPGVTQRDIIDHLWQRGVHTTYKSLRSLFKTFTRKYTLRYTTGPRGVKYWSMAEPGFKASNLSYAEMIVEILRSHTKPMTARQIVRAMEQRYHRTHDVRALANTCQTLARRDKIHRAGKVIEAHVGHRKPTTLYAHGPKPTGFTLEDSEQIASVIKARQYTPHSSEADDAINTRTLALVPDEHMPAIEESARRMLDYRQASGNYGYPVDRSKNVVRGACDQPIADLFQHARNDRLEVRYSALALWLSWRLSEVA